MAGVKLPPGFIWAEEQLSEKAGNPGCLCSSLPAAHNLSQGPRLPTSLIQLRINVPHAVPAALGALWLQAHPHLHSHHYSHYTWATC